MPLQSFARAVIKIPSITTWTRLEPQPRDASQDPQEEVTTKDSAPIEVEGQNEFLNSNFTTMYSKVAKFTDA